MSHTWTKVEESQKFGIAIFNYLEEKPHRLILNVGDTVNVISECNDDWYYGFKLKNISTKGIFPKKFITILDSIPDGHGSFYSKDIPLVKEITAVLREWGIMWKKLYLESKGLNSAKVDTVYETLLQLIDNRRLILSRKLPVDELQELQEIVSHKIDMGNARLGLDMVVRNKQNNIINPFETSTITLFRLHQLVTKRINEKFVEEQLEIRKNLQRNDNSFVNANDFNRNTVDRLKNSNLKPTLNLNRKLEEDTSNISEKTLSKLFSSFNLYIDVKNFVCQMFGEAANILLSLYDLKEGQFISDIYVMRWGELGIIKPSDSLLTHRVVFTDLSEKDIARERVFFVCQIIRIGRVDLKEVDTKKLTKGVHRPFGVAVIEITDILKGTTDFDDEKQYFIPFLQCGDHDFMEATIKKAIQAKDINHKGQGLWVTIHKLLGSLNLVQKNYPHLVTSSTPVARKMGFPDVIMPGDVRNDIYVTIKQGEFRKGSRMSEKSVEVTLSVCNEEGEIIQNVISDGVKGDMISQYRSIVYHHEDRPKWFETIKLAIPVLDSYKTHLKFTMKHRASSEARDKSEKPFAIAYIRLMNENGTTIKDTDHDLHVYRVDAKKYEDIGNSYLYLPSSQYDQRFLNNSVLQKQNSGSLSLLSLSSNDVFQISTLICSTKLTHNIELMGLMKWRDNPKKLEEYLRGFMTVDGEEIVKFLQDSLDILFNILMENSASDIYDRLVFDCLVFILGIVSDQKYSQFKPILDVYIQETFSATLAYQKLMMVLKFYMEDVKEIEMAEALTRALRSLDYIFKFIIHSRLLYVALNENQGKAQFELLLKQLFESMISLVRNARDLTLGVCSMLLMVVPSIVPSVIRVFSPLELSAILIEIVNRVPKDKLVIQRLHCINDFVHTLIFKIPECRRLLLSVILDHVHEIMTSRLDQLQKDVGQHDLLSDSSSLAANELDICIRILGDIMDLLYDSVQPAFDTLTIIISKILRTTIQTVIYLDKNHILIGGCVAVATAILRQMTEKHYSIYINSFETQIDLSDFLMEMLMFFEELVTSSVYRSDWNDMIMLQNWVFLKIFKYFSSTIHNKFSNPFYYEIWKRYFISIICFLTQPSLKLEDFSAAKYTKIISRYQDMRREASLEVRSMWHNLGHHKVDFIPEMVGPILKMTLVPEKDLRKATIPLFFDMMQCEFMSTRNSKVPFIKFEQEFIMQLDILISAGMGDHQYQDMFYTQIRELCDNHKTLHDAGISFVEVVKQLLQLLLEYRMVIEDENQDNKMSCTVNLLNFYHQINRSELYINCLNRLCQLHLQFNNYTEAAYTIMQYAKLLNWSDDLLPSLLASQQHPEDITHRQLKEDLYYEIINFFDNGKMWEKGIELCKELALQYETETFDYQQLSSILKRQAGFCDSIMKEVRPEPEYFRVAYYGTSFPTFLMNRTFIYRGKEYERLSDFVARLQHQFPNSQLMKTLNTPGDDIKNQSNQYIQVNKVTPVVELKEHLINKRLSDQILKYYKVNEVQKFTYSRKKDDSSNDITSMWLERSILVTAFSLPGILRWFPVTSVQIFFVSPLESAIETLEETNVKLSSLVDQYHVDPMLKIDQLGMVLNGVVDAAVNGGISNYKTFYSDEYAKLHSTTEDLKNIANLRAVTFKQMMLLKSALDIHGSRAPSELKKLQAHLEQRFTQMRLVLENEYAIKLTDEELNSHAANLKFGTIKKNRRKSSRVPGTPPRVETSYLNLSSVSSPQPNQSVSSTPSTTAKITEQKFGLIRTSIHSSNISLSDRSSPRSSQATKETKLIELNQELLPQRPLRPDSEIRNRPPSGHLSISMPPLKLSITHSSDDGAPPLPNKINQSGELIKDFGTIQSSEFEGVQLRKGPNKIKFQMTPIPATKPKNNNCMVTNNTNDVSINTTAATSSGTESGTMSNNTDEEMF